MQYFLREGLAVWYPLFVAFIVTALITPLVIYISKKVGLMDDPKRNHPAIIHTRPVPRGGGAALFFGTFITALFFIPINTVTIAIFLSAFLALVVGIIDDKLNAQSKDVSPYLRFFVNILCAVIIVGSGITVSFITNPFGGILHFDTVRIPLFFGYYLLLSQLVAIVWIIWVINMLNWSSGIDGQMPGIVAIAALVIGLLSLRFPVDNMFVRIDAVLSFIIAGSSLGFLLYHFHPARIFPGYGATSIFLLLAVVSMLSSSKLATAILVLAIPTIDALFTISRRLLAKRSPFLGDKQHLHHMLLKLGWSQRQISLFYWVISAILGTIALQLDSKSKLFALIMLSVVIGGGLLFLHFFMRYTHEKKAT